MKGIISAVVIASVFIGGALILTRNNGASDTAVELEVVNNVNVVDGVQIVEVTARGGYQPRRSVAKSGIPTVIRFNTKGTFDCSLSVRIPSMNISTFLPQTGSTDIDVGSGQAGTLQGSCGMGMYPFSVEFQ